MGATDIKPIFEIDVHFYWTDVVHYTDYYWSGLLGDHSA